MAVRPNSAGPKALGKPGRNVLQRVLGGSFLIESATGAGTELYSRVPLLPCTRVRYAVRGRSAKALSAWPTIKGHEDGPNDLSGRRPI
jgi:hypothetical protein